MKIGVHCSVRGGFSRALDEATALGCETLQIFSQSPREWRTRVYDDAEFRAFREARRRGGFDPLVVHATFLPNLCTANAAMYARSFAALVADLERSEQLGADYLVIHPGAYSAGGTVDDGIARVSDALNRAFAARPGKVRVLLENMAGGARRIGGSFRELRQILERVRERSRMGVCFDTCHAYAAGYDIAAADGARVTLAELEREIGLDQIPVFHVNDSAGALGGHRDLHEHIGRGALGSAALGRFLGHTAFRRSAFILETPKRPAPVSDRANLDALRRCLLERGED